MQRKREAWFAMFTLFTIFKFKVMQLLKKLLTEI